MKPTVTDHMSTPLVMVGSWFRLPLAAPLQHENNFKIQFIDKNKYRISCEQYINQQNGRSQLNKASYITINQFLLNYPPFAAAKSFDTTLQHS